MKAAGFVNSYLFPKQDMLFLEHQFDRNFIGKTYKPESPWLSYILI